MASSKEYLEFILEQLSGLEDVSFRAIEYSGTRDTSVRAFGNQHSGK